MSKANSSMTLLPKLKMSKPKPKPALKKVIKFKAGNDLAGKVK